MYLRHSYSPSHLLYILAYALTTGLHCYLNELPKAHASTTLDNCLKNSLAMVQAESTSV